MSLRPAFLAIGFLTAVLTLAGATTNKLSDAEIEGRDVVRQLLEFRPAENLTHLATLKIRDGKKHKLEIPVRSEIIVTETNWLTVYETLTNTNAQEYEKLTVTHSFNQPNLYTLSTHQTCGAVASTDGLTMRPYAGSDFWLADLGLEFIHWPGQKILKKELKRGQSCYVLESKNPAPSTNGYSRVVSWLDIDSVRDSGQAAIVQAEAYDPRNKLLKEFDLKELGKVNGQWQVKEIEIRNVQTGSRTLLKFNLEKP